jgi:SAM-dependent methyltransferase
MVLRGGSILFDVDGALVDSTAVVERSCRPEDRWRGSRSGARDSHQDTSAKSCSVRCQSAVGLAMAEDYRVVNRRAWSALNRLGQESTRPYGPEVFAQPRAWLDEEGWIPWRAVRKVLCLGAGGGQQGPLFASLGLDVTVVDISPAQLEVDRRVAEQRGLTIKTVEADMLDLSAFHGAGFDLVYQPISAQYVPDVPAVYRQVAQTLRDGGHYHVQHWNPVQMQVSEYQLWDGEAYRLVHPQASGEPVAWFHGADEADPDGAVSWNWIHPLGALIGGICRAGFVIVNFAESGYGDLRSPAGTQEHLAAFVPSFFSVLARLPSRQSRRGRR